MSKAIIVADFAYKGVKRKGRGSGPQGLRATLKYLQYRDAQNNHLAQNRQYERWRDRGLGVHYGEIFKNCDALQSKHVLAWTWVVSPAPDLMALVPENQRRQLVCDLTERVVDEYYSERGFDTPEYAYVLHRRMTEAKEDEAPMEQLHTHVILPGTAPSSAERLPVYNNSTKRHDVLFRDIASRHFADALDEIVGPEWRKLREEPEPKPRLDTDELEAWFERR